MKSSNKPYPLDTIVWVRGIDPVTRRTVIYSGIITLVGEDYSDVLIDDGSIITRKNIDIVAIYREDKRIGE